MKMKLINQRKINFYNKLKKTNNQKNKSKWIENLNNIKLILSFMRKTKKLFNLNKKQFNKGKMSQL